MSATTRTWKLGEAFALNGVSDWEGAAQISLQRAREVFAVLQSLSTEA